MSDTTPTTVAPKKQKPWLKLIFYVLLFAFITIQFFQPDKNNNSMVMTNDISNFLHVPDTVHQLLKTACYDCHSNNTNYPWYTNIQPLGWWLKDHIDEGKRELNFQEFAALKPRPNGKLKTAAALQDKKLDEVQESQEDKWMPLDSYTWIHRDAKLSDGQRKLIIDWVDSARAELKTKSNTLATN